MRKRAEATTPGPWERPLDVRCKNFVGAALPDDEYPRGHMSGIIQDYGQRGYEDRYIGQRERCVVVSAPTFSDGSFPRGSLGPPGAKKPPSRSGADLDYIASMHPIVGLAIADWMTHVANLIDHNGSRIDGIHSSGHSSGMAILAARAYLREAEATP